MNSDIICYRCGLINDYHTEISGPHVKAICNGCNKYIKFISKTQKNKTMAQGFYGSICIEDLFTGKTIKGSNGKTYICVDDLTTHPFSSSQKNGKHYVGVSVFVGDDIDQFGNIASISLSQTKDQWEREESKTYVGNLRRSGGNTKETQAATQSPIQQQKQPLIPQPEHNLPF